MHQHLRLATDEFSPAAARGLVRRWLAGTRTAEDIDAVALLTSELVTNAVRCGSDAIVLTLDDAVGKARVSVDDDGPGVPIVLPPSDLALGGRGLHIVDQMAARWGVDEAIHGKRVWFEL